MDYIRGVTRNQVILFRNRSRIISLRAIPFASLMASSPVSTWQGWVSCARNRQRRGGQLTIRAMGHSYFLMKGLNKVGAEMSLTILSYNIKRVINIIGVKKLIEAVT